VVFIKKEQAGAADIRKQPFLLPLVRIEGNNYTMLNIQKDGSLVLLEAEMREKNGQAGPYIRFAPQKIYFLFQ
jgi:hypothetical protein